jgi:hypothetical protein
VDSKPRPCLPGRPLPVHRRFGLSHGPRVRRRHGKGRGKHPGRNEIRNSVAGSLRIRTKPLNSVPSRWPTVSEDAFHSFPSRNSRPRGITPATATSRPGNAHRTRPRLIPQVRGTSLESSGDRDHDPGRSRDRTSSRASFRAEGLARSRQCSAPRHPRRGRHAPARPIAAKPVQEGVRVGSAGGDLHGHVRNSGRVPGRFDHRAHALGRRSTGELRTAKRLLSPRRPRQTRPLHRPSEAGIRARRCPSGPDRHR